MSLVARRFFSLVIFATFVLGLLSVNDVKLDAYDVNKGQLGAHLAAATFCNVSTYETRTFIGITEGFKVTKTINSAFGAVGYIGYLPSDGSIWAVFRGSSSIRNWLSDFDVAKKNYDSYPECQCQVSQGWYNAEQSIVDSVVKEISRLRLQFPSYSVTVTGHSYGAAIAQLLSMDVARAGIPCSMYNFGQPRVGDQKYANFVGTVAGLTTWRVVHNQDIVPHWPFNDYLNYFHACTEEFEDEVGQLHSCGTGKAADGSDTCEDPACSSQFKPYQWRSDDHMTYLGLYMSCDSVSA